MTSAASRPSSVRYTRVLPVTDVTLCALANCYKKDFLVYKSLDDGRILPMLVTPDGLLC
jgi:hypothetical protein